MDIFSLVRLMIALGAWFRQVNVLGADDYIDIITPTVSERHRASHGTNNSALRAQKLKMAEEEARRFPAGNLGGKVSRRPTPAGSSLLRGEDGAGSNQGCRSGSPRGLQFRADFVWEWAKGWSRTMAIVLSNPMT